MKCNKCGKEIEDNATFCPYCGEKVEVEVSEVQEIKEESKEMVNPTIPTVGFGLAIGLYVASYVLVKLHEYVKGFADYFVFLFLLPLGICAMVLTGFGRHLQATRGIKIISWVGMGVLIIDYILMFVLLMQTV